MANNTISQIKIGNTTYDICDAETRNTLNDLVFYYDKMDIRTSDQKISISANNTTRVGYLMELDPTGTPWQPYQACPTIYHLLVHSAGAARTVRLWIKPASDSSITYHVSSFYVNQTNDVVLSMSGVLSEGIAGYALWMDSTTAVTNVYGNISWIAFKV